MSSMQISFVISGETESEFLNYIVDECDCQIYRLLVDNRYETFTVGQKVEDYCYFIKPNSILCNVNYERSEDTPGKFKICPFDEEFNLLPFVQYERTLNDDCELPFRLYVSDNINRKYKSALKSTYKKLSEWIKKNSVSVEKDGRFMLYYLSNKRQVTL